MFRRIVTITVMPLLLLPGLCQAHSHAGTGIEEPADHDSRPHFHLRWFAGSLFQIQHTPTCCSAEAGLHADNPAADHDADAVYFAGSAALTRLHENSRTVLAQGPVQPLQVGVSQFQTEWAATSQTLPHPPFFSRDRCPIYLQKLTFLV